MCICYHSVKSTLCDPMDCSPPGSSVHGILQARILAWISISFSKNCLLKTHKKMSACVKMKALVTKPCATLCNLMDCGPPGSSVHGILQVRLGCHFLLQGIFPTHWSNLGFPHCRKILYPLRHQRSPSTCVTKIIWGNFNKTILNYLEEM